MVVGILLVLTAAVFSGAGSVLEAQGAQRAGEGLSGDEVGFRRLVRRPRYVIGLVVDVLGFLAAAVAMQYLPLFLVQAGVASSVGVTALLVAVLGARLPRRSVEALCAMLAGLVLLALSASSAPAADISTPWRWALLAAALPTALVAWGGLHAKGRARCVLLALAAGLAFTWVAVAARVLDPPADWEANLDPVLLAVAVNGVLGTACFAAALEHGSVTLVSAVNYSTETVLPAAIGLAFLGDKMRDGFGAVAVVGFVLAVGGALLLAGHSANLPTPGRAMVPTAVRMAPAPAASRDHQRHPRPLCGGRG